MPVQKTKKQAGKPVVKSAASKNSRPPDAKAPSPKGASAKVSLTKTSNGGNGATAKPAPGPSAAKLQLRAFEEAIRLLHKRSFRDAKELFEKARRGPSSEISAKAATHIRVCESRLAAPAPEPKSAEEHYNYAVALLNLQNFGAARRYLERAIEIEPGADHVHYALAACHALSGDAQPAYVSLKRAIELQPRNRMAARQDADFDGVGDQPLFISLLYPEK
jgi:tetratricopeptide (TPR) repeat protein